MNNAASTENRPVASAEQIAKGRRTMLLLLAVCLAPIVAAYVAFYVWRPTATASYGSVVSPAQAISTAGLRTLDGVALSAAMRGKWVMALRAPSSCDKDCQRDLYYMRQIRTLQAADMDRVARLWVVDDGGQPDPALLSEHAGLLVVSDAALASVLGPAGHIALIDPRANLMMRFPQNPETKGIVADLKKLLKYSR
jgi:ABC-type taurine transport system substrate-binding protein